MLLEPTEQGSHAMLTMMFADTITSDARMDFPDEYVTISMSLVHDYRYVRSVWMLGLTVLLYDYLLTLKSEIKYMWHGRFTVLRLFFWMCRYWSMIYLILGNIVMAVVPASNPQWCKLWFNLYVNLMAPLHFSFFAIALGRLHAAFNCDRKTMVIVGTFFGLVLAWIVALYAIFAANFEVVELPPSWTGCVPSNTAAYSWIIWIPTASSEVVLFIIVLVRGSQIVWEGGPRPRALTVILRDTLLYILLVIGLILVTALWSQGLETTFVTFPPVLVALISTSGCRMLLNIHHAVEPHTSSQQYTSNIVHLSSIQFAGTVDDDDNAGNDF